MQNWLFGINFSDVPVFIPLTAALARISMGCSNILINKSQDLYYQADRCLDISPLMASAIRYFKKKMISKRNLLKLSRIFAVVSVMA